MSRDDEGNLIEGKGGEAGRRLLARLLSIPHLAAARPKLQLGRRGDVPSQILKVGGAVRLGRVVDAFMDSRVLPSAWVIEPMDPLDWKDHCGEVGRSSRCLPLVRRELGLAFFGETGAGSRRRSAR